MCDAWFEQQIAQERENYKNLVVICGLPVEQDAWSTYFWDRDSWFQVQIHVNNEIKLYTANQFAVENPHWETTR